MAKQKKHTLEMDNEFDFDMFGISSHHNDYRLAWCLNAELGLGFEQSPEPYIISTVKKGEQTNCIFPMYEYHDEENLLDYYLIKNKHEGKHLISEKPSIDFFLFILERGMIEYIEFGVKLRGVSSILAVFPFEPEEFNSSEKLIFN